MAVISDSNYWTGSGPNRAVMKAIKDECIKPTYVTRSDKFNWGGGKWTILNPPEGLFGEFKSQAGNVSIVYLLEFNGKRLLFTGDIEPSVADRIAGELKPYLDGNRVNVFLMTHHGANSSSSNQLDQVIRPWWVVISAGEGNTYHHPQKRAVNRLKAIDGATIWCTPTNGTVTVKINAQETSAGPRAERSKPLVVRTREGPARQVQRVLSRIPARLRRTPQTSESICPFVQCLSTLGGEASY